MSLFGAPPHIIYSLYHHGRRRVFRSYGCARSLLGVGCTHSHTAAPPGPNSYSVLHGICTFI